MNMLSFVRRIRLGQPIPQTSDPTRSQGLAVALILIAFAKIGIGISLFTVLEPDCSDISACQECGISCSDLDDPFSYYGYICIFLGFIWLARYFQVRKVLARINGRQYNALERQPLVGAPAQAQAQQIPPQYSASPAPPPYAPPAHDGNNTPGQEVPTPSAPAPGYEPKDDTTPESK